MSFSTSPKITTSGLIVHLDAANRKSYPGSGTAWNDLSGNNNHFTLINGPVFSTANIGSITYDGSNDFATASLNLTPYSAITVEVWARLTNTSAFVMEHTDNFNTNNGGWGFLFNNHGTAELTGTHYSGYNSGSGVFVGSRNYTFTASNTWVCLTNTFSNVADSTGRLAYLNGQLLSFIAGPNAYPTSTATVTGGSFANANLYIGAGRAGTSGPFGGQINILRIYGRKLSASEILRNYNATRGRFGL